MSHRPARRARRASASPLFTPHGADGVGSLRLAHRLVELMDGRLGCSSAVGMGTTTWFSVPLDLPE